MGKSVTLIQSSLGAAQGQGACFPSAHLTDKHVHTVLRPRAKCWRNTGALPQTCRNDRPEILACLTNGLNEQMCEQTNF